MSIIFFSIHFTCSIEIVLKHDHSFIINGDNSISDSGVFRAVGTIFDYRRIDDAIETSDENSEGVTEWITATGPIREAIQLMVRRNLVKIFRKKNLRQVKNKYKR